MEPEPIEALWERFWAGEPVRDDLVLRYTDLVEYAARRIGKKLPNSVEADDLVGAGIFGLIDAIDKFDSSLGFKFETYAYKRIQGSILDSLRQMDWVPRSVRSQSREIDDAESDLLSSLGRHPHDSEIEKKLEWEDGKLQRVRALINEGSIGSFETLGAKDEDSGPGSFYSILPDLALGPAVELEMKDLQRRLAEAISHLDEREMTILTLYYYEHMKFSEIGKLFKVSESRICQIHMKAIDDLKGFLV